jgi:hypothetical protein
VLGSVVVMTHKTDADDEMVRIDSYQERLVSVWGRGSEQGYLESTDRALN